MDKIDILEDVQYPQIMSKTIAIPGGMEIISFGAFFDCVNPEEVRIHASVETIGDFAFGGATDPVIHVHKDRCAHIWALTEDFQAALD